MSNSRQDILDALRSSGDESFTKGEASDDAPDYSREFDETEGQQFVDAAKRQAEQRKALTGEQATTWDKAKNWVSKAWRYVFEAPHFEWPEPSWGEKLEDPLGYTGKDPERMMELAGIDPDDEPFGAFEAPDTDDVPTALPDINDHTFQRRAHDIIKQRAEAGDKDFYKDAIAESPGDVTDAGFHQFLGNGLINESAESTGWVEDRTGHTVQELLDELVEEYRTEHGDELDEQMSFRAEGDRSAENVYDLDRYGDVQGFVSVLAESVDQLRFGDRELEFGEGDKVFQEIVRALGQIYEEKLNQHQNQ